GRRLAGRVVRLRRLAVGPAGPGVGHPRVPRPADRHPPPNLTRRPDHHLRSSRPMPGITGLAGSACDPAVLPRMLDRMRHQPWYTRDEWAGDDAALGRVGLGFVNTAPQPAASEDGVLRAVLDG